MKRETSLSSEACGIGDLLIGSPGRRETVQGFDNNSRALNKPHFATQERTTEELKLARDIIPEFTGENMSVAMFIKHCRADAMDKVGIYFEQLMQVSETHFSPRLDTIQLMQELATISLKK